MCVFVSAAVFNLEKTFKITYSLLVLHMWLVLRRLKQEGKEGVDLGQYVYEIYNHNVEVRVSKAGVRARLGFAILIVSKINLIFFIFLESAG